MVHVQDLSKRFGPLQAVDRLSFDIHAGESVALWGANGAGKTTALRCLLGLLPYEGTVRLAGHDVRSQGKAARHSVGFVPQELNFHDDMTVRDTLLFYARLKKTSTASVPELLARLGMEEHLRKVVRNLSGGMKQRLALAVALLADPPLLLLDEPTSNLDAQARGAFLALLTDLKADGKTLIFSSHRLEEIAILADRVLVMEAGRLVADGPPEEVEHLSGMATSLKLHLPSERVELALTTLTDHGFTASRNGRSVHVRVATREKGRPIHLLAQAGIQVHDFDVEARNGEN